LLGAVILGCINIAAAFYLALRIGNKQDENLQQFRSAYSRASHLLCRDPWMAIYILFWVFFWVWLFLGSAWNLSGVTDEDESCSDTVVGYVRLSVGLGWFFIFGGSMALGVSVCCSCCDNRDYGGTTTNGDTNPTTPLSPFDAENPQPTPPYAGSSQQQHNDTQKQNIGSTSYKAQEKPNIYSPEVTPVEVDDDGIPVAHAVAIPTPMPSAPPADFDSSNNNASRITTEEEKEEETSGTSKTTASNLGSAMGKTVGKLFKVDDSNQQALEDRGKKTGEAVGKGYTNVKGFVNAKLNKK